MDEIFEQMLSASSWGDGVGGMPIDSLGALQSLSKMGSMMPTAAHLIGTMENQGLSSQEHQDDVFNAHEDHLQLNSGRALLRSSSTESGLEGPSSYRQSLQSPSLMGGSWQEPFMGSVPLSQGKPGPFPPSGDGMSNDLHLGKRTRGDEETMNTSMVSGISGPAISFMSFFCSVSAIIHSHGCRVMVHNLRLMKTSLDKMLAVRQLMGQQDPVYERAVVRPLIPTALLSGYKYVRSFSQVCFSISFSQNSLMCLFSCGRIAENESLRE